MNQALKLTKNIFSRQLFFYVAVILLAKMWVDYPAIAEKRKNYLLGIFYNGFFENYRDGIVYFDYMVRRHPQDAKNYENLAICYEKLGLTGKAQEYQAKAKTINKK